MYRRLTLLIPEASRSHSLILLTQREPEELAGLPADQAGLEFLASKQLIAVK
jgi:hypothetical protein